MLTHRFEFPAEPAYVEPDLWSKVNIKRISKCETCEAINKLEHKAPSLGPDNKQEN